MNFGTFFNLSKYLFLFMIYSIAKIMYGRKPCQLEMRKNRYLNHMKKIQEISSSNNQYHRTLKKERN